MAITEIVVFHCHSIPKMFHLSCVVIAAECFVVSSTLVGLWIAYIYICTHQTFSCKLFDKYLFRSVNIQCRKVTLIKSFYETFLGKNISLFGVFYLNKTL